MLAATGCADQPPALPPETGFSTTGGSTTGGSTIGGSATTSETSSGATLGSGGCISDEQCGDATPACEPGSGECVECRPEGEHCPPQEYCEPTSLECTPGCDDDDDCPGRCDLQEHLCVDCIDNGDCSEPASICTNANTCVECIVDGDCPTGTCDAGECLSMGHPCEDDSVCDTEAGEQCCSVMGCLDRCMIPCATVDDCPPMEGTVQCGHGHCTVICQSDADCAMWSGFTCGGPESHCHNPV